MQSCRDIVVVAMKKTLIFNQNPIDRKSMSLYLVGATRFELATSASRTQRSTKLSHAPIGNSKIIYKKRLIVK